MAKRQALGIAEPGAVRDHLEAIDNAIMQLVATRTRLMNEVQDDFTALRTSAQIFREIFFGVELPIESPEDLIERAGGPYRLIEVSYRETGNRFFALADVVAAIPKFKECFPIRSFDRLVLKLEDIREQGPDVGSSWFVEDISDRHMKVAIEREHRAIQTGGKNSIFTRRRTPIHVSCCCGGEPQPPAKLVATALAELAVRPSATRWTGVPARRSPNNPPGIEAVKARRD